MPKIPSEADILALREAEKNPSASVTSLAIQLNCSHHTIKRWLKELGITIKPKTLGPSPETLKAFKKAWRQNVDYHTLKAQFGVGTATVSRWRDELGLQARPIDKPAVLNQARKRKEFMALWEANVPINEMAKQLNASRQRIVQRIKDYDLDRRPIDALEHKSRWSKRELAILKKARADGLSNTQIAVLLPGRHPETIAAVARQRGFKAAHKTSYVKRRKPPATVLRPRIRECLETHGASPTWRIRDFIGYQVDPRRVEQALTAMRKASEITRVEDKWELVR